MAQANLERNSFVRGLITEASALTFPENASIDEDNFILNRNGSRQRRLGMDFESSGVVLDTDKTSAVFVNNAIQSYKWSNVNNNPTLTFGVVQVGNELWFIDLYAPVLSNNIKNGGAPYKLDASTIGYVISGNEKLDFTSINGHLIIVGAELQSPIYLGYADELDSFYWKPIDLEVRDIWGVFDGYQVDERPTILSDSHKYNLMNQGWPISKITKSFSNSSGTSVPLKERYPLVYNSSGAVIPYSSIWDPLRWASILITGQNGTDGNALFTITAGNGYPSNADLVSLGKKADGTFSTVQVDGSFLGTTPAPRGKFIVDAFARGGSRRSKSGLNSLLLDADDGTVQVATTHANRVFYSGVASRVVEPTELSPNYTGTVFFTQTIESLSQLGKCYQEADPSSEDIPDLLASDGGTIKIGGASNILKLVSTSTSVVVIAENGVWEITGPDGVFKATDFSISKISNVGAISAGSIVDAEGSVVYWSNGGIYQLTPDKVSGILSAQNITETTIQSLYNGIPTVGAANSISVFDPSSRQIRWLYNDTDDYDGVNLKYKYNRELVLDVVLGAFYTNTINSLSVDSPYVAGYLVTQNFNTVENVQSVVVNGEQVQVNGEDVVVTQEVRSRGVSQTKYLTFRPNGVGINYGMTFSHYKEGSYLDWKTANGVGVDAAAFLITGYELFADSQRVKQATYLTTHFNRTETGFIDTGNGLEVEGASGCLVQSQWDFANTAAGGKFGTQFQAYRLNRLFIPTGISDPFDYGTAVVSTKSKLRGSGKALSLRFDTQPGKDLYLLGWALNMEGRPSV